MATSQYPQLPSTPTNDDVVFWIDEVARLREQEDIGDFDNLVNRFIRGRKVAKVPSSSTDVDATDQEGDFNYDDSFMYLAVLNSGNLVWRRVALATF